MEDKNCSQRLLSQDDSTFREYIENTTAHGASRIFNRDYGIVRRLFWLFVFLAASGGCLYNCANRIALLTTWPTSTAVASNRVRPARFPAVTVCNLNSFTASGLEEVGLLELGKFVLNINPLAKDQLDACKMSVNSDNVTGEVLVENLTYQATRPLREFITQCAFLGQPCDLDRDFEFYSAYGVGACFTFNGQSRDAALETNGTGSRHGLFLEMNINQSQYTASAFEDAGVMVVVHQSSEPPEVLSKGIFIPPGRIGFVGIKQEDTVNNARKNCIPEGCGSGFKFIGDKFDYSASACLMDCLYTSIADKCNCYSLGQSIPASNPDYINTRNCTFRDICCIQEIVASADICNCPLACESSIYESSVSYSSIPADYVGQFYSKVFGDDFVIDRNIAGLSLYFQTLNVRTETTSFSYSLVALLSDIGGQLGLFLGVSVISFLELCTWLMDEGLNRLCCYRGSSRRSKTGEKEGDHLDRGTGEGTKRPHCCSVFSQRSKSEEEEGHHFNGGGGGKENSGENWHRVSNEMSLKMV